MDLSAVNSADRILVLEGETDLPPGSRLSAELRNRDGKTIMRDKAVVRKGSFFFDFDLERLSEFSSYNVLVMFDPERAPLGVRQVTGLWGEALQGAGVRKIGDRRIYMKEQEIRLSASALGNDWEGRDFENMEAPERSRLTEVLERYVQEKSSDKAAKLALARAYLAAEPKEWAVDSRAHQLLVEASRTTETDRNGRIARELVEKIRNRDVKKQEKLAKQKAVSSGSKYRHDFRVRPGQGVGAFKLGMPYKLAARYFKLDRPADFSDDSKKQKVVLLDFHNLELTYGPRSRKLIKIRTTSTKFKLPEGLGVGSSLEDLEKAYGDAITKPKYKYSGKDANGHKIYRGRLRTAGLTFEFKRRLEPKMNLTLEETVTGM